MKKILTFIASAAMLFFASSCEEPAPVVPENLTVNPESLVFIPEGETKTFTVLSNYAWVAQCDNWITLSQKSESASDVEITVAASVAKNSGTEPRTGKIKIMLQSGTVKEITVTQEPYVAPAGIYSAQDLQAFANAIEAAEGTENEPDLSEWATEDGVVRLYDDIDAGALQCFPISQFPSGYVLDGQNHTISMTLSSVATKVGLFKTFKGTAKNLKLSGSVTVDGDLEAETHIGTLAANAQFATLENCENNTMITVNVKNALEKLCVIPGGFIGKATSGLTMKDCTNNGAITFESIEADKGGYYMIGGLVGAYGGGEDGGVLTVTNCHNTAALTCKGGDKGSWNYVAGIISNIQNAVKIPEGDATYSCVVENCTNTGDITIDGIAKTRGSGLMGRFNAYNKISNCSFTGTINVSASSLERNVAGISGFQEKTCQCLIDNCTFGGKIVVAEGHTKAYYIGGILSSGCAAVSVIQNCKTTKDSYVSNYKLGNIGMIVAHPSNAFLVKDCKVAGTINNVGEQIVISAENYDAKMVTGYNTKETVGVRAEGCGYNAE